MDAVSTRLAAQWSRCRVEVTNTRTAPPADGASYLEVQYPVTNSAQITIGAPGDNWWRDEGVIRGVLHLPTGAGTETAALWADQLSDIFRGKVFGGVECFAPSSTLVDDGANNGNYIVISVAIPYWHDYLG
ncbi:hypothetical protein KHC28_00405 [Ancylobacter sonchi]|uniref:phage tail terminator-like protein n=1 Tax=Ancylobacter sonchi TaxID=1937790 RepID=UPI001BD56D06|nr:phage tail terminator-like protein [Ancylobacter sonchi]MBS7532126.1 hypothetical protein [Ancylobacter sonchi]